MILGLIESQRGKDAAAVAAFQKAETHLAANSIASYYLGQSLVLVSQPDAAAEAFERAISRKPAQADLLEIFQALGREWGKLILKDASRPEPQRKQAAAAVWRRLTEARPKDSVIATQVADLFRQVEMTDEALALYKKAIDLSAGAPQYREYLGEFFDSLKRSDEALATWREMAAGKQRTADNLARLAEVLSGFGYLSEAVPTMAEACQLKADDFTLQLEHADLLGRAEKYDAALPQLEIASKLASNAEENEAVLAQRIKHLHAADKLTARIAELLRTLPPLQGGQGGSPAPTKADSKAARPPLTPPERGETKVSPSEGVGDEVLSF